ncbi:hypothetical protein GX50_05047 [[Emmonsia] crescens]|uniref:Uncharacterized protein n=1 Tax=[Emmonsia] crescens TaxID=73230 RepID=A0A2B7ZG54_9EURO|nr:hypothetical protein GX50_05047 [Emmonsia crescens]
MVLKTVKLLVLALITLLAINTQGAPSPSSLAPRGRADILLEILKAIGVFTEDKNNKSWASTTHCTHLHLHPFIHSFIHHSFVSNVSTQDFETNKEMCEVFFGTRDGGHCYASVECQKGGKRKYKIWNVCYVGGRQYFTDPRIGKFSITFTKRDGSEGEGLTEPILQVGSVGNWMKIPVSALATNHRSAVSCKNNYIPIKCDEGPFVCRYVLRGNRNISMDRTKRYSCGIPVLGASFPKDVKWD